MRAWLKVMLMMLGMIGLTVAQENKNQKFYDLIFEGESFYEAGNYDKALKVYLQAFKENPKNAYVNYLIGRMYLNEDKLNKAYKYYKNAIVYSDEFVVDFQYQPELMGLSLIYDKWNELSELAYQKSMELSASENKNKTIPDLNDSISFDQALEELNIVHHSLEKAHPGYYWYSSEASWNKAYQDAKKELKPQNAVMDVYVTLFKYVEHVKCGHTMLQMNMRQYASMNKKYNYFPYEIYFDGNKLFVVNDDENLPNAEVLRINGAPVDDFINEVQIDKYADGNSLSMAKYDLKDYFSYYIILKYGDLSEIKVDLYFKEYDVETSVALNMVDAQIAHLNESDQPYESLIDFEIDEAASTAYLHINSFSNSKLAREFIFFDSYMESFFTEINEKGIQNLVLDLSQNPGGYFQHVRTLLSYFVSPNQPMYKGVAVNDLDSIAALPYTNLEERFLKEQIRSHFIYERGSYFFREDVVDNMPLNDHAFKGEVYVITSGKTFSGASIFTTMMKEYYPNISVVGEESGGGSYGTTAYYAVDVELPYTNLNLSVPIIGFQFNVNHSAYDRGVSVDHYIAPSFQRNFQEDAFAWCKYDIASRKLKDQLVQD